MKTKQFPIVFEPETTGAVSAYVPGLPVYAAAETMAKARTAIRALLSAYLEVHPDAATGAQVQVATVKRSTRSPVVTFGSVAALLGGARTRRKAATSRANGKLGGRPRLTAMVTRGSK